MISSHIHWSKFTQQNTSSVRSALSTHQNQSDRNKWQLRQKLPRLWIVWSKTLVGIAEIASKLQQIWRTFERNRKPELNWAVVAINFNRSCQNRNISRYRWDLKTYQQVSYEIAIQIAFSINVDGNDIIILIVITCYRARQRSLNPKRK